MKKIILLLIIFIFTQCGCSKKITYVYTNILDEESKKQLVNVLNDANINQESIDKFIDFISDYNKLSYTKSLKTGFVKANIDRPIYDYTSAIDSWTTSREDYDHDINCRIATFTLIQDVIEMKNANFDVKRFPETLNEALNKRLKWEDDDISKFVAIFHPFRLTNEASVNTAIKNKWNEDGIRFLDNSTAKLLTLVEESSKKEEIKIIHAGVLIDYKDSIIFIEKVNPMMPFQMSKFVNRKELFTHLKIRYKESSHIVAFENDMPLLE